MRFDRLRMKGMSETQAARIMGITRERARALECKALKELRHDRKVLQLGRDRNIVWW